ncbi:MAG: hypothetical protein KC912_05460 [Proteobacteria bacterium]|nr:hypothetical protein [Pseudomonadota bacterium]
MLLWMCGLALATVLDFEDVEVSGEISQPSYSFVSQRHLDAPIGLKQARRLVRQHVADPSPVEAMRRADALQVVRDQAFIEAMRAVDAGADVDLDPLQALDREARRLYLDAAPGLADDHAARALFLAARLGVELDLDPIPELDTCLELDPHGAYASQARVLLADTHFASMNLKKALPMYATVAAGEGRLASYARYRLAWCQYNLGDFESAVSQLEGLWAGSGPLAQEARRDAVLFASALGVDEARSVLARSCGTDPACLAEGSRQIQASESL